MNSEVIRKLDTWLPLDVYKRLLSFSKENASTGLGKFDYGVAIRILLDRSKMMEYFDILNERIEILELELNKLKSQPKKETGDLAVVRIGTNVEYAPFVEFGTRRMASQPFLEPAAMRGKLAIMTELKAYLAKKGMEF